MNDKKGFFGFLKNWVSPKTTSVSEQNSSTSTITEHDYKYAQYTESPHTKEYPIITEEMITYTADKLTLILEMTGFGGEVKLKSNEPGQLILEIHNAQDVGRIIGKEGMTLEALQTLGKNFLYQKFNVSTRVYLDVEDYRQKRLDTLTTQAEKAAKIVLTKARKIDLKPMNPEERRLIHSMFQKDKKIRSYSVGSGLYRHIVLERRNNNLQNTKIASSED